MTQSIAVPLASADLSSPCSNSLPKSNEMQYKNIWLIALLWAIAWCSTKCCCLLCQLIISITHAFVLVAPGETSHSQIRLSVQPFSSSSNKTHSTFIVPIIWINLLKLISICKITFFPLWIFPVRLDGILLLCLCGCKIRWDPVTLSPLTCSWSLPAQLPRDFGCEQGPMLHPLESVQF